MHRNTLLVIALLAIIASFLIGFNAGKNLSPAPKPTPVPPSPTPGVSQKQESACGVTFSYPSSLQPMESSASGVILVSTANPDDSIIVYCQKDIPRIPLVPERIETKMIGSVSATLYHDGSGKDGTPIDKLIFTHPKTKLDIFIVGFGPTYQQLLQSLKLE